MSVDVVLLSHFTLTLTVFIQLPPPPVIFLTLFCRSPQKVCVIHILFFKLSLILIYFSLFLYLKISYAVRSLLCSPFNLFLFLNTLVIYQNSVAIGHYETLKFVKYILSVALYIQSFIS